MLTKEVKKKTQTLGVVAILLAATLSTVVYYGFMPSVSLKMFSSQQELDNFVVSNTPKGSNYYSGFRGPVDQQFSDALNPQTFRGFPMPTPVPTALPAAASQSTFWQDSSKTYSGTNVQVVGVDEADFVKTDGNYVYLVSNSKNAVYILDADPENAQVTSKISFSHNVSLAGIYLGEDSARLVVLGSVYKLQIRTANYWTPSGIQTATYEYYSGEDTRSFVKVYDISDKANPVLTRDFAVSGSYFNSRMIGDYVYAVISQPVRVENQTVALPSLYTGTKTETMSPSSIYYFDRGDQSYYNYYTYTSVVGLSISNDAQEPTDLTVMMGGASNLYVSANNIYITYPGVSTSSLLSGPNESTTEVHRISISGKTLRFDGEETVSGSVLNQYSMDEYEGYFRIATTSRRGGVLQNNIYVIDEEMRAAGKLEDLAPGESLHSARFAGDKAYLVTFKKTDPLFVIDLTRPDAPEVLGELKIPGYSDYLHPYDETHLIGVGKETQEAQEGDFAWYQGLKLSLFNVSNVSSPQQLAKTVVGDRGTDSQVLSDPKAFLFDKSRSLLVIPVNLAQIDKTLYESRPSTYGDFVWQGACIFNVTLEGGFELRGNITHVESQTISGEDSQLTNSNYWITRALYIDNILYTISNEMVKLNDLYDITLLNQIILK